MQHQYHHLTPNMQRELKQLGKGSKFIDIRSGAALYRRGLAAHWPGIGGAYRLTEAGSDMLAKQQARQQVCRWVLTEKKHLDQAVIDTVMEYAAWVAEQA